MRFMVLILKLILIFLFTSASFAQDNVVFRASIDANGIQRVEIIGGSYYFKPNYIIVKVNVPVELIVKKEPGITPHDIVINAPDAGIDFKEDLSNEPKVIRFTPTKTGKYAIYCSKRFLFFKSHRERGMEGILEVVE